MFYGAGGQLGVLLMGSKIEGKRTRCRPRLGWLDEIGNLAITEKNNIYKLVEIAKTQ